MSKFVGTGPSSYEKRIYRAAVSRRLGNTGLGREEDIGRSLTRVISKQQAGLPQFEMSILPG